MTKELFYSFVTWQRNEKIYSFSQSLMDCFHFDTAKMLLLRKLFLLPVNLIPSTFSCTFSMLHLINLNYWQLISRPTNIPLLPFNTHSPCFFALLFSVIFAPNCSYLKSPLAISCIIHSQMWGGTAVTSFCQGIHSFTMPSGFSVVCRIFLLGWVFYHLQTCMTQPHILPSHSLPGYKV